MKKNVAIITILIFSLFSAISYCADDAPINYETLFGLDFTQNNNSLWKLFEDEKQDATKLLKERKARAIYVGRYDNFPEQYKMISYTTLSLYRSPFQVKVLFLDYYMNKLIALKKIDPSNKMYLKINNFIKDYGAFLYPRVYKKTKDSRKKSIIPNKLLQIDFFRDEKYIETYQNLFNGITDAVSFTNVQTEELMPKMFDESNPIKLKPEDKFYFYKVDAVVNEILIRDALDGFFNDMKELLDISDLIEFYKLNYYPKLGEKFTPIKERTVSINIVYDAEKDFDYRDMERVKKIALIHEYLYMEKLAKDKESPAIQFNDSNLIEAQEVYKVSMFPTEDLFNLKDEESKGYYDEVVDDFYSDLDDAMDITEDAQTSKDLNMEILSLNATIDETALMKLIGELKKDIIGFAK